MPDIGPAIQAHDLAVVTLRNDEWYAFEMDGRRFFATVYNNGLTGFLELSEIPDPYVCKICGENYQSPRHSFDHEPGTHEYEMRGQVR